MPSWKFLYREDFKDSASFLDRWNFETGYLIRNNEQQYYRGGLGNNVFVSEDGLVIVGKKESYGGASYTSGSIYAKTGLRNFAIEALVKTPEGQGLWPAIWYISSSGSHYGEIDVMEILGQNPSKVYVTVHNGDSWYQRTQTNAYRIVDTSDWVTYRAEISVNLVQLYINGISVMRMNRNQPSPSGNKMPWQNKLATKINLALGGDWPGPVSDDVLPAEFKVKYIDFYEEV